MSMQLIYALILAGIFSGLFIYKIWNRKKVLEPVVSPQTKVITIHPKPKRIINWSDVYHNTHMRIKRVTQHEYEELLYDRRFIPNNTTRFTSIAGLFEQQKVKIVKPKRKKENEVNNQKA